MVETTPVVERPLVDGQSATPWSEGGQRLERRCGQRSRILDVGTLVPVHLAGWSHYTYGPGELAAAFTAAGLSDRLVLAEPGCQRPLAFRC